MLTSEQNERYTRVGPGTPTGELMRRYWHPIAAVSQMKDRPTMPIRLLGEDFILYRDESGTFGLGRYEKVYRSIKVHPDPFMEFCLGWLRRNPPTSHGREAPIVWDSGQFHHDGSRVTATVSSAAIALAASVAPVPGGGRCNVTHACFEPRELVKRYPRGSRELMLFLHEVHRLVGTRWRDFERAIRDDFRAIVSHQDQVVVQPPNTDVLAHSQFTPYAALAWTDRPAIAFQFHPEFSPEFAKALIRQRSDAFPAPQALLESLDSPNDRERVAIWIRRFLQEDK